ncbi:hypothetical protein A6764_15210 [Brevibacillus sp. WF146]|uniref:hypothetical protein n=1 Tax=Brevibacillus sp. WF146 TaxID=319501 RepID=UPI0007EDECD4|nr:hypothetical protein [Brevibacillus sp. WF146]UYZ12172.1 hypothetical protein A6764_15210 [Brevibacillus sp. WF146]
MSDIIVHEGKKYRKVDRKATVGDRFLIITRATGPHFTEGKVYTIANVYENKPEVVDNFGTKIPIIDSRYVVLEPVVADLSALESELAAMKAKVAEMERQLTEAKAANRLKVGDYAKVVNQIAGFSTKGQIVKITEDDGTTIPFRTEGLDGNYTGWYSEESLVRATDEEVAEAKRKLAQDKIQPGVYVKLQIPEGSRPRYGWGDARNGDIGKVASRDGKEVCVDFPSHSGWCGIVHELVLATEAERKQAEEAAKWAAIGRKPGEFKVGDIAEVVDSPAALPNGTFFEVKEVGGSYVYDHKGYVYMSPGKQLKLVAPVESVVNLRVS